MSQIIYHSLPRSSTSQGHSEEAADEDHQEGHDPGDGTLPDRHTGRGLSAEFPAHRSDGGGAGRVDEAEDQKARGTEGREDTGDPGAAEQHGNGRDDALLGARGV